MDAPGDGLLRLAFSVFRFSLFAFRFRPVRQRHGGGNEVSENKMASLTEVAAQVTHSPGSKMNFEENKTVKP